MGRKEMTGRSKHRHRPNTRRLAEQYNYVGEAQLDTTLRLTSYNAYHVRSDVIQPGELSSKKLYADAEMHWAGGMRAFGFSGHYANRKRIWV